MKLLETLSSTSISTYKLTKLNYSLFLHSILYQTFYNLALTTTITLTTGISFICDVH